MGVRIEWQSNRANVNGSALFEAVTLVEVANRLEQCTADEHGQPGCGSQSANDASLAGKIRDGIVINCIMEMNLHPPWAVTPEKIAEAVKRIVETAHPVRVILFGSQARGGGDRDSDVDLVIVEREVDDRYAEMVRLHQVVRNLIMPVDILVIGERDFEEWSDTPGSVYHTARREGRVLYEAA